MQTTFSMLSCGQFLHLSLCHNKNITAWNEVKLTQPCAYESGKMRLVSRKPHNSGSWYSSSSRNRWNGLPFLRQLLHM